MQKMTIEEKVNHIAYEIHGFKARLDALREEVRLLRQEINMLVDPRKIARNLDIDKDSEE